MKCRPSPYIKQRRMKLGADTTQTSPRFASLHAFLFWNPSSFGFWHTPTSEPCLLTFVVGFPPSFTVLGPRTPRVHPQPPSLPTPHTSPSGCIHANPCTCVCTLMMCESLSPDEDSALSSRPSHPTAYLKIPEIIHSHCVQNWIHHLSLNLNI